MPHNTGELNLILLKNPINTFSHCLPSPQGTVLALQQQSQEFIERWLQRVHCKMCWHRHKCSFVSKDVGCQISFLVHISVAPRPSRVIISRTQISGNLTLHQGNKHIPNGVSCILSLVLSILLGTLALLCWTVLLPDSPTPTPVTTPAISGHPLFSIGLWQLPCQTVNSLPSLARKRILILWAPELLHFLALINTISQTLFQR